MSTTLSDKLNSQIDTKESKMIKPFIKWAGGKSQLLGEIRKFYPSDLGKSVRKYAEQFVGGGAVLFDILSKYHLHEIYISDTNAELINTYKVLRDFPHRLIDILMQYQKDFLPRDGESRKEYYYIKRNLFNHNKAENILNVEMAALFIYLNRTCFNGLYRVNSKGEFNVPMGSYVNPLICNVDNLQQASMALQNVRIVCADYKNSNEFIDKNTFVYFDPPYRPLNASSNFTSYTENDFGDIDQIELANFVQMLAKRGAYILASNSDPKNLNAEDNFIDNLYSGLKIKRIQATRMINSNVNARGVISELLISNKGETYET